MFPPKLNLFLDENIPFIVAAQMTDMESPMRTLEKIELIYRDPKIRDGHPCIVGTGIRVLDIVRLQRYGNRDPEQIAESFKLTLAQVYTALAYYHEHKAEIDADIREDIRIGEELKAEGFGKPENSIFP